jgi:hypothetical protein
MGVVSHRRSVFAVGPDGWRRHNAAAPEQAGNRLYRDRASRVAQVTALGSGGKGRIGERFITIAAYRPVLLVLDNVSDAGQVRPVLPAGSRRHRVLVTSRDTLGELPATRLLDLRVLDPAQRYSY